MLRATDLTSGEALVEQLVDLVSQVRPPDLAGVGVGVPSVVEFDTGRVVSSVNVPLADVALRHVLSERLGAPVFVDNDATVAALAEAFDEHLRPVAQEPRDADVRHRSGRGDRVGRADLPRLNRRRR